MKFLFALTIIMPILLHPISFAASCTLEPLETICATGCLPSTEEDWRRVCGGMIGPELPSASISSGAAYRSLSRAEREVVTPTTSKSILRMTSAKNQGCIGSCTAFAIAACIEYLVPGLTVSEAELFLRIKLLGKLGRSDDGVGIHSYVTLLREGVVRSEDFIPYDKYNEYFYKRKNLQALAESELVAASDDFKESVEDILRDRELPPTILVQPVWRVKPFHVKYRGIIECEVREGYWREQVFNCFPLKTAPMSDGILDYFKHVLNSVPIVVSVATLDQAMWHPPYASMTNEYTVNVPSPEPSGDRNYHAICFCGYDNVRKAFRIKNSWSYPTGKIWADNGFAWLSYAYVKKYIGSAMVILTHPTDTFIDADIEASVRSTRVISEHDRIATTTFDAMLAAYNARRR